MWIASNLITLGCQTSNQDGVFDSSCKTVNVVTVSWIIYFLLSVEFILSWAAKVPQYAKAHKDRSDRS